MCGEQCAQRGGKNCGRNRIEEGSEVQKKKNDLDGDGDGSLQIIRWGCWKMILMEPKKSENKKKYY